MNSANEEKVSWQWSDLCGRNSSNFTIWNGQDFGHCFEQLTIVAITHAMFAIASSYHFGRHHHQQYRGDIPHMISLHIRLIVSVLLCLIPLLLLGLTVLYLEFHPSIADIVTWAIQSASWLIHSGFVWRLKRLFHIHIRGPKETIFSFLLTTASTIIQLRTAILHMKYAPAESNVVEESLCIITSILHLIYIFTWVPNKRPDIIINGVQVQNEDGLSSESRPLINDNLNYGAINVTGQELGVAEEGANVFSKLFFWWAKPLMRKGARGKIKEADDLFTLPHKLNTDLIDESFCKKYDSLEGKTSISNVVDEEIPNAVRNRPMQDHTVIQPHHQQKNVSLLRALNQAFGCEYYSLGILKFFGDNLTFAGPLLLNLLVSFMEDPHEEYWHGYLYALGLFLCTFLSSLCSTHFNYMIQKVALKIRASLITTIYRKTLAVNSVSLSKFSTGQVVNFMSTDTDRITNFCPSFHSVWSLPVQVAIALYLLYTQVGIAFIAGVGFAVILIPINRWLANKIGKLSSEMMHYKDQRVKLMNEILHGIRVIKFYVWEMHFRHKVNLLRDSEMKALKGRKYLDAWCVYFWATTPVLISILTFMTYSLLGHQLTAAKVFTSMALFNILLTPLNAFPWVINGLMEAWVSIKRLESYMQLINLDLTSYYTHNNEYEAALQISKGHFSWSDVPSPVLDDDAACRPRTLCLENIDVTIQKGQLVGVIGKVGSGKSSLLNAILGEMQLSSGVISINNIEEGFGYAGQESWIQHGTVMENILFGLPYRKEFYDSVIYACALTDDLKILPSGDQTEIGENGVTLSGGQKSRIALARAVYQNKSIYILDDPLAAVDAHVAQHLFENCIQGLLKDKTRILCTHHTKFLQSADVIFVMKDGVMEMIGPPSQVLSAADLTTKPKRSQECTDQSESKLENDIENVGALVEEEEKDTGVIKMQVYKVYWKSVGSWLAFMVLLSLFLMQASRNVTDWWLSYWVTHSHVPQHHNKTISLTEAFHNIFAQPSRRTVPWDNVTDSAEDNIKFYLTVYGSLAASNSLFTLARAFLFAYGGLCAAASIHNQLIQTILKAPTSFFDVTPVGRIMNRFSSDTYATDDSLPFVMNIFFAALYGVLGTLVITCYGLPWFIVVLLPLAILYYNIQNYYRFTSREIKRITSVTLSPIYAHFSESISGLSTIRAMRHIDRFQQENKCRLDTNQKAQFAGQVAAQWLGIRLQMIGVAMVTAVALIAVLEHHFKTVNQGLLGLALSYALAVTGQLNNLLTNFTETEKQMVSVERADQYITQIPQENEWSPISTPPVWPMQGIVQFHRVILQYRANFPNALDGVSFETNPGEKIGIVGRTGSGKSSIFLSLFRMVNLQGGHISIDGFDIALLPIKDVRSRFAIIPQDPFLFSGTVRDNLAPTEYHDDSSLWNVLQRCHLVSMVERLGGLDALIEEGGHCFSVGQRQLICLARALLTKAKILCIDEATASVDHATDKLIQATISQEFTSSTVLTIAHRINTILNNDRVMVMSAGKMVEFDNPRILLENKQSLFYGLYHGSY